MLFAVPLLRSFPPDVLKLDHVDDEPWVPLPNPGAAMSPTHLLRQQDGAHLVDVQKSPVPTIATRGGHAKTLTAVAVPVALR